MAIVSMKADLMPLVSITVITYNSASTVVETLNSVYCQTYRNLELIVSDDSSSDDTVNVCKKWIKKHENRFERVCIIESKMNTGISANINRADAACTGECVKGIAGDDKLVPGCVETFVDLVSVQKYRGRMS